MKRIYIWSIGRYLFPWNRDLIVSEQEKGERIREKVYLTETGENEYNNNNTK